MDYQFFKHFAYVAQMINIWTVPVPLRDQWNENDGYCCECALISAGMFNGQYCSQYDARMLGTNSQSQQVLLGDGTDITAAGNMHLNAVEYSTGSTDSKGFLAWIKQQMVKGYPVAMGVFMNKSIFGPGDYQPDYDHVVTVTKIESQYTDGLYHDDDIVFFSDNGLYTNPNPTYIFQCQFSDFLKDRKGANSSSNPNPYSLNNDGNNFGIVITGKQDSGQALPVSVQTDTPEEVPEIKTLTRPVSSGVNLNVTVSGLSSGSQYVLYRYTDFSKVPPPSSTDYATNSETPVNFTAAGTTYSINQMIPPDQNGATTAIFRAVPALH